MVDAFPVNWVMRRRIVPGSGSWRVIKLPIITSANLHVLFKLLRTLLVTLHHSHAAYIEVGVK